jgi:hypothetical protein
MRGRLWLCIKIPTLIELMESWIQQGLLLLKELPPSIEWQIFREEEVCCHWTRICGGL